MGRSKRQQGAAVTLNSRDILSPIQPTESRREMLKKKIKTNLRGTECHDIVIG